MHDEAFVVYLWEAGKRFGLWPIQNLLLVHIHYIEVESLLSEASIAIRLSYDLEEEPVAVSFSICVWLQIQIEFSLLHLNGEIKITAFKHRVKSQITLNLIIHLLLWSKCALIDRTSWYDAMQSVLKCLCFDILWNEDVIKLTVFIESSFLAVTKMKVDWDARSVSLIDEPVIEIWIVFFLELCFHRSIVYIDQMRALANKKLWNAA